MKGIIATFLSAAWFAAVSASNVVELTPDNFDKEVLKSGKPSVVKFYAPWCGHCKNLAPVWEELADSYVYRPVNIAKVDADKHKELGHRFKVEGFPTMYYFDGYSSDPVKCDTQRDLASLQSFVEEQSGVKAKVKPVEPSNVVVLTDANFDKVVNGDKHVLVDFYAPWCGHCKDLAPIYESVANTFATEPDVVIAKLQADAASGKESAAKHGVKRYPIVKFFPKGSTNPLTDVFARTEEDLVNYVNGEAGTERAVGGSLLPNAGVIPEFDAVMKKLVRGDTASLATVTDEIKKLAEAAKQRTASIYLEALGKLRKDGEYIEKQLGRVGRMLEKPDALAREKRDELTYKKNILLSFPAIEDEEEGDSGKVEGDSIKDEL